MPQQVFGAEAAVSMVNRALANTSPAHTVYLNQVAAAGTTDASQYAFAAQLGAQYAVGKTAADLSALLLGNMGVSNAILQAAVTDYIAFHGTQNIGIIALQLGQILSGLEGDVTFGAAAAAWNQEVTNAYQYSSSPNNNTPQTGDDGASTTKLSRFTDVLTGKEFTGYLDYNQFTGADEQTLTSSDRLTGTDATDDILFAQLTNTGARPTLNGVEIVSIDAKGTTPTLDLSDANGVTTVINTRSNETSVLTFSNLKNLVDVVVRATNSNTVVSFNNSVVAGAADVLNVTVDAAGVRAKAADITANGIETLNITASGAASVLGTVTSANVTKLTVAGDQNLSVGTKATGGFTSTDIATVDASAATGNLFLNLTASAARDQTVTTGTGNDVVVTGNLSATDTFNLGEGNDRVVLTTANTNQAAKLLGVEEVESRAVATNLNLTNAADVKLLAVADLGAASVAAAAGFGNVTAVKSGTAVVFEGRGAANAASNTNVFFGDVTYNLANATGTSDVIDFKFNNAGVALGANSTVTIGNLVNTGNNVETMNLAFSDVGATNTVMVSDISAGAATALKTLNVTADSKVTLNTVNDLLKLTSVDATGVKGAFTAAFGALGDTAAGATVKFGGAGNNVVTVSKADLAGASATAGSLLTVDGSAGTGSQTITLTSNVDVNTTAGAVTAALLGGTGADTINVTTTTVGATTTIKGGAGADKIVLAGTAAGTEVLAYALGDTGSTLAGADTVTGFVTTSDKIDLRSFGFDSNLTTTVITSAINGTANEFGAGAAQRAVAVVSDANGATVYVDTNGDAKLGDGDLVISLVGASSTAVVGDFLFI